MNAIAQTEFNPSLAIINGIITTTSLKVAEHFGKQHKNVLQAIDRLECSLEFNQLNFQPVEYSDAKGEKRPAYEMTKDGFTFLAMGFTGKEAAKWKEAYINAFNAMADQLQYGLKYQPIIPTKKAVAGGLTLDTQNEIKQLIQDHAARLPKDKQARYIISMWSALGSHFEIKKDKGDKTPAYKYIKEEARLECLSLLARWSVDDLVTLTLEQFENKINERIKLLPAPAPLEGGVLPQQQHNSITINLAPLEHGKARRWLVSQLAMEIAMLHPLSEDQIITTKAEFIDDLIKKNDYVVMKKDQLIGKVQAIF